MTLASTLARTLAVCGLLAGLAATPAAAQEAPDALVQRVSQDVLATIKADPRLQAGDVARVRELVETKLLAHFDFTRMTMLAMGRNWARATPEQQAQITQEFRTLLVRTYSSSLTQYRDERIELRPLRADPAATDVTVRTEVVRSGKQPVQIDYAMARTPQGWKAYDVIIGGISLVTNYREEFNEQIRAGGVDGLLRVLAERNRGAKA